MTNDTCSIVGCNRPLRSAIHCSKHHYRLKRHGAAEAAVKEKGKPNDGPCALEGCERSAHSKGYCKTHYERLRTTGEVGTVSIGAARTPKVCSVDDCLERCAPGRPKCADHQGTQKCSVDGCNLPFYGKGFCGMHLKRFNKHGDPNVGGAVRLDGKLCRVEVCERPARSHGLCAPHRIREINTGSPGITAIKLKAPAGSGSTNDEGYRMIYVNGEQMRENVYVMEQMIGRSLFPGETVHHKNLVRDDNRPENLELWLSAHPTGARVDDLVVYAVELLTRHRPDLLSDD